MTLTQIDYSGQANQLAEYIDNNFAPPPILDTCVDGLDQSDNEDCRYSADTSNVWDPSYQVRVSA